jgi:hypothetical protein
VLSSANPLIAQQAAITLVDQAASNAASHDQGASEETGIKSGIRMVDSADAARLSVEEDPLAPSGLLNIIVVRGGINMGQANTTQR